MPSFARRLAREARFLSTVLGAILLVGSGAIACSRAATKSASASESSSGTASSATASATPSVARAALPALDAEKVEAATRRVSAIEAAPVADRQRLAADALYEVERGRLPVPIVKALGVGGMAGVDVAQKSVIFAQAISESESEWAKTCPDPEAFSRISKANMAPAQKSEMLFRACNFARFNAITEEQAPTLSAMSMALGLLCLDYLDRRGSLSEPEKALAIAVARDPLQTSSGPSQK